MSTSHWTPTTCNRTLDPTAGSESFIYMELIDSEGVPLNITNADVSRLDVMLYWEQSLQEVHPVTTDSGYSLQPVDSIRFPGLHYVRVDSYSYYNNGNTPAQAVYSLTTTADPAHFIYTSVNFVARDVVYQPNDPMQDISQAILGLLGANQRVVFGGFDSNGNPTTGTITLYDSDTAAIAEDPAHVVGVVTTTYSYSAGKLSKVIKSIPTG